MLLWWEVPLALFPPDKRGPSDGARENLAPLYK